MKYFLISFFKFLFFSVVFYIISIILISVVFPGYRFLNLISIPASNFNGYMYSRSREADSTRKVDVLILGSSQAYRGYDSRIFRDRGYRIFNMGSSGQTPKQSYSLLMKYIDQFEPILVILDVAPKLFESDGIESSMDLVLNNNLSFTEATELLCRSFNIRLLNTTIASQARYALGLNKNIREAELKGNGKYIRGGYVESYRANESIDKAMAEHSFAFRDDQVVPFRKMVDELKRRRIQYIIIQSPVTRNLYSSYNQPDSVDAFFSTYGDYVNFNTITGLPDDYFYDVNHLNQYGVNKFNDMLIDTLENRRWLENR